MSDITFDCEACGQHLAVDESSAGMEINCPTCKHSLRIPKRIVPQVRIIGPTPTNVKPHSQTHVCPSCGSPDLIKASAAVEQGTSMMNGQQQQVGATIYGDGAGHLRVAPNISTGTFKGVQQTALAQKLAPPPTPVKSPRAGLAKFAGVIMSLIGLFCASQMAVSSEAGTVFVVCTLFVVVAVGCFALSFYFAEKDNEAYDVAKQKYERCLNEWQKLWYCKKCGWSGNR